MAFQRFSNRGIRLVKLSVSLYLSMKFRNGLCLLWQYMHYHTILSSWYIVNRVLMVVCLKDLLPDMQKSWPDLLHPSSTGFWYCFNQSSHFVLCLFMTHFSWVHSTLIYYNTVWLPHQYYLARLLLHCLSVMSVHVLYMYYSVIMLIGLEWWTVMHCALAIPSELKLIIVKIKLPCFHSNTINLTVSGQNGIYDHKLNSASEFLQSFTCTF